MSTGYIFVICALFSLAGLGVCHKIADFYRCKPRAISAIMFSFAAVVLWAAAWVKQAQFFPPFTASAVIIAVVCGACAALAILTFQIGIRFGRISTSWLVINLSTIIPALLSLVVYREWQEGIKVRQIAGLILVFVSIILLYRDKSVEIARGEEPIPQLDEPRAPSPQPVTVPARAPDHSE